MKIPKRLKLARACFYQLPNEIAHKTLIEYEVEFRHQYAGIFYSRSEGFFFFELPHAQARDAFLASMELSLHQQGIHTERQTIYPKPK